MLGPCCPPAFGFTQPRETQGMSNPLSVGRFLRMGKTQDMISCCTKGCAQDPLLAAVRLGSWRGRAALRYPRAGACSRLHRLEQGLAWLRQCQADLVLGGRSFGDKRWH